jgi:hypothetical protein
MVFSTLVLSPTSVLVIGEIRGLTRRRSILLSQIISHTSHLSFSAKGCPCNSASWRSI